MDIFYNTSAHGWGFAKGMLSFEFRSSFRFSTSSVVCLFLNSLVAFVNLGPDLVIPFSWRPALGKRVKCERVKKGKENSEVQPFYCHYLPKFGYYI